MVTGGTSKSGSGYCVSVPFDLGAAAQHRGRVQHAKGQRLSRKHLSVASAFINVLVDFSTDTVGICHHYCQPACRLQSDVHTNSQ